MEFAEFKKNGTYGRTGNKLPGHCDTRLKWDCPGKTGCLGTPLGVGSESPVQNM
jgi:hypothetical protein